MPIASAQRVKVRRVIAQDEVFLCGMCRSNHTDRRQAEDCVERCFAAEQNGSGLGSEGAQKFRCSYCKRVFPTIQKAKACAGQCKASASAKRQQEQSLAASSRGLDTNKAEQLAKLAESMRSDAAATADHSHKFRVRGHSFICKTCQSVYPKKEQVISCYDRHQGPKNQMSYRDRVALATKRLADQKKLRDQQDREFRLAKMREVEIERKKIEQAQLMAREKHIYKWDGKSFTCRGCRDRYPSRKEVLVCYQAHLDEAKLEKSMKVALPQQPIAPVVEQPAIVDVAADEPPVETTKPAKLTSAKADLPDKAKFIRDGGKYLCRTCNERYFTKAETIRCYNSH